MHSFGLHIGMAIGIASITLNVSLFFCMGVPLSHYPGLSAVGAVNKTFCFSIPAIAAQLVWNGVADFKS